MRRSVPVLLLLVAPAALSAPPSTASVVKYRTAVMKGASNHFTALSMIAKGETDRTQDSLLHAEALNDLAKTTAALFPEGTGPAPGIDTEAKAEIWTQKDRFAAAVRAYETETAKLLEIVRAGTDLAAMKAQLSAVGGSCGDCHEAFRVDDDH